MATLNKGQRRKLYYFTTLESAGDCVASNFYGVLAEVELVGWEVAQELKKDVYINTGEDIVGVSYYDGEGDN